MCKGNANVVFGVPTKTGKERARSGKLRTDTVHVIHAKSSHLFPFPHASAKIPKKIPLFGENHRDSDAAEQKNTHRRFRHPHLFGHRDDRLYGA